MPCELCDDDGRIEVSRSEYDGRRTWWAVPCRCPAGARWEGKLGRPPPADQPLSRGGKWPPPGAEEIERLRQHRNA